VTADYPPNGGSEFSGQVNWVEFDAGIAADDQNHLITSEERLRVAMAKQ
jgi:arylsulfatase